MGPPVGQWQLTGLKKKNFEKKQKYTLAYFLTVYILWK